VYNYHLYGEGDVIAMGGKKENFDQVVEFSVLWPKFQ
jgi:hypothetical protein